MVLTQYKKYEGNSKETRRKLERNKTRSSDPLPENSFGSDSYATLHREHRETLFRQCSDGDFLLDELFAVICSGLGRF